MIKELHQEESDYSICELCSLAKISRAGYYKWLNREDTENDLLNRTLVDLIIKIHLEYPDMGYRRIHDWLQNEYEMEINDKRVYRLCQILNIQSTIKHPKNCCTRPSIDPFFIAENILDREFTAERPNQKWLTDVTEFKYYEGPKKKKCKIYLSAILDLFDRRIVAYTIGDNNNNELVFDNFRDAVKKYPNARPIFHSDRGFQYTSKVFHDLLEKAGMTQSMSRVGRCIDNGPMEGFWGIIKRERYYGKTFTTKNSLIEMIENYIEFYNNKRVQRKLGVIAPMKKYNDYYMAA